MKKSSKKNNRLMRIILWCSAMLVIGTLGLALFGYTWIQGYLKSEAFRTMLVKQFSKATNSNVDVDGFSWSGENLFLSKATLTPKTAQGWKQIEIEGVQSTLDWSQARQGLVRVPLISMDWLKVELPSSQEQAVKEPLDIEATIDGPAVPAWLKSWVPNRTEITKLEVQSFELAPAKDTPSTSVKKMKLTAKPASDEGAWIIHGEAGEIMIPSLSPAFRMKSLTARMDSRSLTVNNAVANWRGESEVTARGEVPFQKGKDWKFNGHVSNLDLNQVLSKDWQERLSGILDCDYDVNASTQKAKIKVKNGIAQNMAVLDRVADFTRTDRFRRVVLDEATADVERKGDVVKVTNLVLQSNGLIRVEGSFTMNGQLIDGTFHVGVSPETLRWIPGAQGRVFTEEYAGGPPGLNWTTVRVTGDINKPSEDLSNRLLAAAGKALLIDTPLGVAGKSLEVLGVPGVNGKDGSGGVLGVGKEMIQGTGEGAGKAVESGVDILKGFVPIFGK